MKDYRAVATDAMNIIEAHYPEFLVSAGIKHNDSTKYGYYVAVLQSVRKDPLPNEAAQSILESKLSERISTYKKKAASEMLANSKR